MAEQLLIEQEKYLKSGIHIGNRVKTKYMAPHIYNTRTDGLSILNLQKIDERLKMTAQMMGQYAPEDILVAGRRENSWKPIKKFEKSTGIKAIAGRYPPGLLTNPSLENYMEVKLLMVSDPWHDKNAIRDALAIGIPVISLCDTNNVANNIDFVVPCNNKGRKSVELVYHILAREYLKARGKEMPVEENEEETS